MSVPLAYSGQTWDNSTRVNAPDKETTVLLDYAVDLLFEIFLMRGDCCEAAKAIMNKAEVDETALEECARLDDSLARTYRTLQQTVKSIQLARAQRGS
jgi:hypothetical protein